MVEITRGIYDHDDETDNTGLFLQVKVIDTGEGIKED